MSERGVTTGDHQASSGVIRERSHKPPRPRSLGLWRAERRRLSDVLLRPAAASLLIAIVASAGLFSGIGVGAAARQPKPAEVQPLLSALPAFIRTAPRKCVRFGIMVSSSGRYAKIVPVVFDATHQPCVRYASNGYWLLRKATRWKIIFNGSVPPPCSLGVPADLSKCFR